MSNTSSIIVNSNGCFFKLSLDGVLEEIPFEEEKVTSVVNRVGLTQNLASSVSKVGGKASGEQSGLVGVDVHGTRLFLRARI